MRDAVDRLSVHTVLEADGPEHAKRAVFLLRETDWDSTPTENSSPIQLSKNRSPGSSGNAEDFIWVNSYEWRVIPLSKAKGACAWSYGHSTPLPRAQTMNTR